MANIIPPNAPNLPLAPLEYFRTYFDQLNNILRLYFNQLDGYNRAVANAIGYFQARTTQTVGGANTASRVTLDTIVEQNAVNLDTTTNRISVMRSGRYTIQFSVAPATSTTRYLWFRLNGSDIVESTYNGSGSITLALNPADYVEMYWASSSGLDTLPATGTTGFCPATSSVNVNVIFVST